MSDHLPECGFDPNHECVWCGSKDCTDEDCICDRLRAAQERGTARAYDRGLVDAIEVVKYHTVPRIGQPTVLEWLNGPSEILSAINNLRSK